MRTVDDIVKQIAPRMSEVRMKYTEVLWDDLLESFEKLFNRASDEQLFDAKELIIQYFAQDNCLVRSGMGYLKANNEPMAKITFDENREFNLVPEKALLNFFGKVQQEQKLGFTEHTKNEMWTVQLNINKL